VAVGTKQSILSSPDGLTWTIRDTGNIDSKRYYSVVYGNGQFVVVGDSGKVRTSMDGISWATYYAGTNGELEGVAYGNNRYVAVGWKMSLTSTDGIVWTQSALTRMPQSIVFGKSQFVAVGLGDTLYASYDGITWVPSKAPGSAIFTSVTYGKDLFIAVGTNGTIISSNSDKTRVVKNGDKTMRSNQLTHRIFQNNISMTVPLLMQNGKGEAVFFNIVGKKCYSSTIVINDRRVTIPSTALPKGIYIVWITDNCHHAASQPFILAE